MWNGLFTNESRLDGILRKNLYMKIAYATIYDLKRIQNLTGQKGTAYFIDKALREQLFTVNNLCPLKVKYSKYFFLKDKFYKNILKKKYQKEREIIILKDFAKQIQNSYEYYNSDIIFSNSTLPVAYLKTKRPIFFWVDATFAGMLNYYPNFKNLCKETIKNGNLAEKAAIENCKVAIYTSNWAAKTAIDNYGINPNKVKVVPTGANFEKIKNKREVYEIISSRSNKSCALLFVGNEWERKGGELAIKIADELNKNGIKTLINIVGFKKNTKKEKKFIRFNGFINRMTLEGQNTYQKLLRESHFLILPTKADCTPAVIREAAAFGLPSLATKTGGIPTIVKDNINGKLFSIIDGPKKYIEYIEKMWTNYCLYLDLAKSSYNDSKERLNWDVAGKKVRSIILNNI
jgi:glycosyltransferase involved in cell wall biosynthesis